MFEPHSHLKQLLLQHYEWPDLGVIGSNVSWGKTATEQQMLGANEKETN